MKKLLYVLLVILPLFVLASSDNQLLLKTTKELGEKIYRSCILTPPSAAQALACATMYTNYIAQSQALNAPLPMVMSKDPSPYTGSPYDICIYEVGHLIFGKETETPYCPTLPKSI